MLFRSRRLSGVLGGAVIARAASVAVLAAATWAATRGADASSWAVLSSNWVFVAFRVGVGLILPGVFVYMVSDCVKRRSTQSATGLLYFASPFIYAGELAAAWITAETGWPM